MRRLRCREVKALPGQGQVASHPTSFLHTSLSQCAADVCSRAKDSLSRGPVPSPAGVGQVSPEGRGYSDESRANSVQTDPGKRGRATGSVSLLCGGLAGVGGAGLGLEMSLNPVSSH